MSPQAAGTVDKLDLSIENVSDVSWEELVDMISQDELEGAALQFCRCSTAPCQSRAAF